VVAVLTLLRVREPVLHKANEGEPLRRRGGRQPRRSMRRRATRLARPIWSVSAEASALS
jgi:hypothetical protein